MPPVNLLPLVVVVPTVKVVVPPVALLPLAGVVPRRRAARRRCVPPVAVVVVAAPRGHFFVGGGGGVWAKKVVTLCGLRISEKKEILRSRQYCKCILIESKLCHTILQYYHTIL
jgi:hypothetical protein